MNMRGDRLANMAIINKRGEPGNLSLFCCIEVTIGVFATIARITKKDNWQIAGTIFIENDFAVPPNCSNSFSITHQI